jgi:hypothetical protein
MMPCLIGSVACAIYYFDESQAQLRAVWVAATFLSAALTFTIFSLEANSKQVGEISGRKIMALASWVCIPLRNSFARRLSCRLHRELTRNGIDAVPRDQTHPKSKRSYFHEPTQLVA